MRVGSPKVAAVSMRIGTIRPIIRHKHLSLWLMATAILICPAVRRRRYANGFSVMPQSDNGARMVSELCNQSDLVALRLQA